MSRTATPLETQLLRLPTMIRRTGLSRSSIYRRVAAGTFPSPVKIGERSCAWASHEVDAWIAATIALRDGGGRVAR
ncbi:helix-turn-helix transcriptional regulator [Arenimonas sp. MALMAid1274]|uniref:helix-turn-helix transcriptional regulator n=1 Tax=Arenimonas sp. MALMAid1274 TaxID=3411630 RepID=UPI003BA10C9E